MCIRLFESFLQWHGACSKCLEVIFKCGSATFSLKKLVLVPILVDVCVKNFHLVLYLLVVIVLNICNLVLLSQLF